MRAAIGLAAAGLLLAACAAQVSSPPESAASDQLVVRTSSALQVWDAKGDLVRSLGRAVASPDGSVYYTLDGSPTAVRWVDAKTGRTITQLQLDGSYAFANERELGPTGLSPNGRWLVLVGESAASSRFALIDTALLKLAAVAEVPGAFGYDAISDDGTSLYLVERIGPQTANELGVSAAYSYRVRVYDVPSAKLSETLVVDVKLAGQLTGDNNAETRVDGIMRGIYQSSVPSADGRWNFSFYYNPGRGPFIHVLHLDSRSAFCILDLPVVPGGYEKRLGWSLALTPSGQTLYAVNGALGLVSSIDAATLKVMRTTTIAGLPSSSATATYSSSARVAQDARKLWFAAARGVALVDTRDFALRGLFLPDHVITSISLSPDGHRLFALSDEGTVWMIDATTGRQLGQIPTHGAVALLSVTAR